MQVDKEVLKELPVDIRQQIEREMRRARGSASSPTSSRPRKKRRGSNEPGCSHWTTPSDDSSNDSSQKQRGGDSSSCGSSQEQRLWSQEERLWSQEEREGDGSSRGSSQEQRRETAVSCERSELQLSFSQVGSGNLCHMSVSYVSVKGQCCCPLVRLYIQERQEYFLRQGQLSVLTHFGNHSTPRVTAVAHKISRSFCQKCRWQVTAKHAYTLRM